MADLRGATSEQMMQNKQLEQRVSAESQVAQRLRGQLQDVDGKLRGEQQAVDIMDQKRRATELETQDVQQKVEQTEREIYGHK